MPDPTVTAEPVDAPAITDVTLSYDHPDNPPYLNPVTYSRPVPVEHLHRLIDLLDELADAT